MSETSTTINPYIFSLDGNCNIRAEIIERTYGPTPDSNGYVDLSYYTIKYVENYLSITTMPEGNLNYLHSGIKPTNMAFAFVVDNSDSNSGSDDLPINPIQSLDISNLDTSNVTNMMGIFAFCAYLTTLDLSNWNTSNVTNMGAMFGACSSLTTIDGIIDMSSCTNYESMFAYCENLKNVKIKNPPPGFNGAGLSSDQYTIVS
ncbi:BspA family leucine-rich repeat surface protein [Megamonas funiformis]|uniref:BspA family leucine-rich repeat surface protein n=1 Tax=Megamonas funiformis TaxID=437897 RepID=UPI003F9DD34F